MDARQRRRLFAAASIALVVGSLPLAPSATADDPAMRIVGRWSPSGLPDFHTPGNLRLETASDQRLLYAVGTVGVGSSTLAFDLDSLRMVAPPLAAAPDSFEADQRTGDLVAAFSTGRGVASVAAYRLTDGELAEQYRIDLSAAIANGRVLALRLTHGGTRALLLSVVDPAYIGATGYRSTAAVPGTVRITNVDLAGRRVEWSESIPNCPLPVAATIRPALGWVEKTSSAYFACTAPPVVPTVKTIVPPTGVGRLVVAGSSRTFELFPRGGDYSTTDSAFDAGSGRLLLFSQTSGAGSSVYVFDATTNSWVGSIGAGNNAVQQHGLDERNGRLYFASQDPAVGLVASDIRATPVSQGAAFPSLANDDGVAPYPSHRIVVDHKRSRVVLQYSGDEFLIVEDRIPHFVPPEEPDPDVNTLQIDEKPGETGANVIGAAQAYGASYRFVGGYDALRFNITGFNITSDPPVYPGTRQMRGAFLDRLSFANDEASGEAVGADRDAETAQETEGFQWPYEPAVCVDFSDQPTQDSKEGATVRCEANRVVEAHADSGRSSFAGPAPESGNGSATTTSSIRLDAADGVVSTVTSTASDITLLGGAVRFGGVSATAVAKAHGRAGTAKAEYVRSVRDVVVGGQQLCGSNCDPDEVARQINARFLGLLRVDFPEPDLRNSDGGYEAVVRLRVEQHVQAVALNEQPDDRIEVPGMVVTLFTDNTKPSRTLMEFAGAAVEARYGIFPLGGNGGGDNGGPGFVALPESSGGGGFDEALPNLLGGTDRDAGLGRPASNGRGRGPGRLLELLGWGFLRNGVGGIARTFMVWAILLAPVYLSARRRLFLDRGVLLGRGQG